MKATAAIHPTPSQHPPPVRNLEDTMKKPLLPLGLATTLVLATLGMAIADAHGGDAVFGCC